MTANITQFHSTVESYQGQLDAQNTTHVSQVDAISEKCAALDGHYNSEMEQARSEWSAKVKAAEEEVTQARSEVDDIVQRLKTSEETVTIIAEEKEQVGKRWQDKLLELKQKYLSKLKELQESHDAKIKDLLDSSAQGDVDREQVFEEMTELRTKNNQMGTELAECQQKLVEKEQTCDASQSVVLELQAQNEEFVHKVSVLSADLDNSKQSLEELAKSVSERDSRIEVLTGEVRDAQMDLSKLRDQHEMELKQRAQEAEQSTNEKLGELKKKAEMRLGQIKKQLQGNGEEAVSELNETVSSLEARVSDLEQDIGDKEKMVLELQGSETVLSTDKDKLTKHVEDLTKNVEDLTKQVEEVTAEKAEMEKRYEEKSEKVGGIFCTV